MGAQQMVTWKPLGELLVERRLLTVDELDDALEEQSVTGERLGAILVGRRVVASAVVTTVLAEQEGVELETQDGFGSGLFSRIAELNGNGDLEPGLRDVAHDAAELTLAGLPGTPEVERPALVVADELAIELDRLRNELAAERKRRRVLEAELRKLRAAPAKPAKVAAKPKAKPAKAAKKTPASKTSPPKTAKPKAAKTKASSAAAKRSSRAA